MKEKNARSWKHSGNKLQHDWCWEQKEAWEEVAHLVETQFAANRVPSHLKEAIEKGKKSVVERMKDLAMADAHSWSAVQKFKRNPLCATETEESRWTRSMREADNEFQRNRARKSLTTRGGYSSKRGGFYGGYGGFARNREERGGDGGFLGLARARLLRGNTEDTPRWDLS